MDVTERSRYFGECDLPWHHTNLGELINQINKEGKTFRTD